MTPELLNHRKKVIREMIYDKDYIPLKLKDIAFLLGLPRDERDDLRIVLEALVEEGVVERTAKGKYIRPENRNVTGTFTGTARGFGFVTLDQGDEEIFIPPAYVNGAFHKDRVLVRIKQGSDKSGKNAEGMILKILERGTKSLVGTWTMGDGFGFVIPDDSNYGRDIYVSRKRSMKAKDGDKVIVGLRNYGTDTKNPEGEILEVLGNVSDPATDVTSVLRAFDIEEDFPKAALTQAWAYPQRINGDEILAVQPYRMDLRDLLTVTIDGEDARDLDDAITIHKEENESGIRYHLGVHIADVSEYVKEGSALDQEALERGTSVYLADRVVPMLPRELSNGICSLNSGADRLALSCLMSFDSDGNVQDYQITESVIRVDRRLSYTGVQEILDGNKEYKETPAIIDMCYLMAEAAAVLKEKRRKRGSIDFDFPESKIILDEKGYVKEIKPYERNTATDLIEDFMLLANETVAEDSWWQEIPFVYRSHDDPDAMQISRLSAMIRNFGYYLKASGEHLHPKEIQKLLVSLEGKPEEALISRLALRSMKRAGYTTVSTGHFGLSARYYTHFTSPIRRYPDLQIHRIIKENLHGHLNEERIRHYEEILPEVAAQSSKRERRAQEAEREVAKLKKAEYMSHHLGETFEGLISSVVSWGFFVELSNTVEGLVPATALLDDYYIFDESNYRLVGSDTGREFALGQKIRVVVTRADKTSKAVDFIPEEFLPEMKEVMSWENQKGLN